MATEFGPDHLIEIFSNLMYDFNNSDIIFAPDPSAQLLYIAKWSRYGKHEVSVLIQGEADTSNRAITFQSKLTDGVDFNSVELPASAKSVVNKIWNRIMLQDFDTVNKASTEELYRTLGQIK